MKHNLKSTNSTCSRYADMEDFFSWLKVQNTRQHKMQLDSENTLDMQRKVDRKFTLHASWAIFRHPACVSLFYIAGFESRRKLFRYLNFSKSYRLRLSTLGGISTSEVMFHGVNLSYNIPPVSLFYMTGTSVQNENNATSSFLTRLQAEMSDLDYHSDF